MTMVVRPWPLWKRLLAKVWQSLECGDYEYIRFRVGRFPFNVLGTVYELRDRGSWHRRLFPWRLRFGAATLLRQFVCSACTRCHRRFSLSELVSRDDRLMRFQSGSICHRSCRSREEA